MTQAEFADKNLHDFLGMVCDARICGKQGSELSMWMEMIKAKILAKLRVMHQEVIEDFIALAKLKEPPKPLPPGPPSIGRK